MERDVGPALPFRPQQRSEGAEVVFLARHLNGVADRNETMPAARWAVRRYEHVRLSKVQPDRSAERRPVVVVVDPLGRPDPRGDLRLPTVGGQRREHPGVPLRLEARQVSHLAEVGPDRDGVAVMLVRRLRKQAYGHRRLRAVGLDVAAESRTDRLRIVRLAGHLDIGPATLAPQLERKRHRHTVVVGTLHAGHPIGRCSSSTVVMCGPPGGPAWIDSPPSRRGT
jgi:hypothetical protein